MKQPKLVQGTFTGEPEPLIQEENPQQLLIPKEEKRSTPPKENPSMHSPVKGDVQTDYNKEPKDPLAVKSIQRYARDIESNIVLVQIYNTEHPLILDALEDAYREVIGFTHYRIHGTKPVYDNLTSYEAAVFNWIEILRKHLYSTNTEIAQLAEINESAVKGNIRATV